MNGPGEGDPEEPDEGGSPLAELSEQVTRRLQAGDPVGLGDFLDRYPSCSGPIRGLLPTLRGLAELGRSMTSGRRPGTPNSLSTNPSKARDQ